MRTLRWMALAAGALLLLAGTAAIAQPPAPPGEDELLKVLRSDAPLDRKADALRLLGRVGTRNAVPALAQLLADEKLAHRARQALEQIPDPAAGEALRQAVPQLQGRLLAGVLISLGARRDARAVGIATRLVASADRDVAAAAAYALGRIATPEAARAITRALGTASDAIKPDLYDAALRCADELAARNRRKEALDLYERLRGPGAPAHIRAAATRGAVLARGREGAAVLASLLRHSDEALFALGLGLAQELTGREVTQAVTTELPRLPVDRQSRVILALGNRGDRSAAPAVLRALKHPSAAVRLAAVQATAKLADASAVPALLDAAAGAEGALRDAVADSLVRLPGRAVDEALIGQVAAADAGRGTLAIEVLSRRQAAIATPALLRAAAEAAPQVRAAALRALGGLASAAEVPALVSLLLKAESDSLREAAEQALIRVCTASGNPAACSGPLVQALAQAQPAPKAALLRVLESVGGPQALDAVRAAMKDEDAAVRETALQALAGWSTADAAPTLLEVARSADAPAQKLLALRGFLRLAGDAGIAPDRRLAMCTEAAPLIQRAEERRQWLGALGAIPLPQALTLIEPHIGAEGVSEEACAAAVAVADKLLSQPGGVPGDIARTLASALAKVRQHSKNADTLEAAGKLLQKAG